MKRMTLIMFLVLVAGCASTPTPIPDPGSAGARVFKERCSGCHALAHPKRLGYNEWERKLELMERRMEQRRMPPLTPEERRAILGYLRKYSR